jgi:hypothetical protein
MFMNAKILLCFIVAFSRNLLASEVSSNSQPQQLTNIWRYINYSSPKPSVPWDGGPIFTITSGEQWGQVSRGMRMDIMDIKEGIAFFKTNAITARLYRANGDLVEPTEENKKLLNAPIAVGNFSIPGEEPNPQVMTYFPWGANTLHEAWIEVSIGAERYWLEIPYGLDRNPADPLPPAISGGPLHFVPAMNSLTEHDHILRWENIHYVIGKTSDDRELTLIQSNPFWAQSLVDLYRFSKGQDLYSPRTSLCLLNCDGSASGSSCVDLHLDESHYRRTDTFSFSDYSARDLRCCGQIEIKIDEAIYKVSVPSSLYKYVHGHAYGPGAIDFTSKLRVGMTFSEIRRRIGNYNISQKSEKTAGESIRKEYTFAPGDFVVVLTFDKSNHLQSWKCSQK